MECLDVYYDAWPANRPVAPPPVIIIKPYPLAVLPHEDVAEKPDSVTVAPFHSFGDTLLYDVFVSEAAPQMAVTVILKTSTYEGRCMNYPVGSAVGDTISDLYPADTINWHLDSHWFSGDTSYFQLSRTCVVGVYPFNVVVRDYAAEGILEVKSTNSGTPAQGSPIYIPKDFERWKSTADPDSDGFTVWEEYRGFLRFFEDSVHTRLDSTVAEVFLTSSDSINQYWSWALTAIEGEYFLGARLLEYGTISTLNPVNAFVHSEAVIGGSYTIERNFCDFKSLKYDDESWKNNPLCTPLGLETFPWDRNRDTIKIADNAAVRMTWDFVSFLPEPYVTGVTYKFHDNTGSHSSEYEVCNDPAVDYPGTGGTGEIVFYAIGIENVIEDVRLSPEVYHFPDDNSLFVEFRDAKTARTIAHEFGHMQGVDHHCDDTIQYNNGNYEYVWVSTHGNPRCVMKYNTPDDFPTVEAQWYDSIGMDGHRIGVILDDAYGCFTERANRP